MKASLPLLILFSFLSIHHVSAQCEAGTQIEACTSTLSEGYHFLKSFKVDGKGGEKETVEYSYVFTKGTSYFLNVCSATNSPDGIVVTISDASRRAVATNKIGEQLYSAISYTCNATGIYYITYTFEESQSYCGGSVLGFKR